MAMTPGGNGNLPMHEINVTPLVDVMLVLLIIFMVAAPHLEQGIEVDLPQVTVAPLEAVSEDLVITVTKNRQVFLDRDIISQSEITAELEARLAGKPERQVYLRADQDVDYGFVVKVMAAAKKAGISGLGMVTEPETIKAPGG